MTSDPFVSTLQAWMQAAMQGSMRHFLRFARESGLSMSHFGAIFHIHRLGSCGVGEVGDHLGVTSAAASQMLDRLVQHGLILRAEDPDDRRLKRIELTEAGQRVLDEGIRARQGWVTELAASLTDDEKQTVSAALNILLERSNQLEVAPA